MSEKHTPGPWRVKGTRVYPSTGIDCICTMQISNQPAWDDDARLIAAAPDLLLALGMLMDTIAFQFAGEVEQNLARAAIAKATGGAA